jgi:hypothetical protein
MKTDLREYSSAELSLLVFNDEGLYKMRRSILRDCEANKPSILAELFEYTEGQLEELVIDLKADLEEESK